MPDEEGKQEEFLFIYLSCKSDSGQEEQDLREGFENVRAQKLFGRRSDTFL